jgi:radical SAM protein with 4Fe4S-binding SPASM domain
MQKPISENAHISVLTRRRETALRPMSVICEITTRCVFKCVHCYQTPRSGRELTAAEWSALFRRFRDEGALYLTFSGGEPLSRPDFFELASLARKLRFMTRLFTNAALIDDETARRLRELQFQTVEVSLYGASPETYGRVTGRPENFEKAVAGIKLLVESGLRTVLKFPMIPENAGDLGEMDAFARNLGLPARMDFKMHRRSDGSEVACLDRAAAGRALDEWFRRRRPLSRSADECGPPCDIARKGMTIGPYGDVYPCPLLIRLSAGNVRNADVYEIWEKSPLMAELRTLKLSDMEKCRACSYNRTCGRCPALSYEETGKFTAANARDCMQAGYVAGKNPVLT